jgi:hypothetical protein
MRTFRARNVLTFMVVVCLIGVLSAWSQAKKKPHVNPVVHIYAVGECVAIEQKVHAPNHSVKGAVDFVVDGGPVTLTFHDVQNTSNTAFGKPTITLPADSTRTWYIDPSAPADTGYRIDCSKAGKSDPNDIIVP